MKIALRSFALVALLFLVAFDSRAGEVEKELEKLQGDWVAVYEEFNGVSFKEGEFPRIEATIKDDKWISKAGFKSTFTITINPAAEPKQFDRSGAAKPFDGVFLGIYKLEGDTLTICANSGEKTRPTGFTTKGNLEVRLFVYKRVKP